jgi:hypothetical protein
MKIERRGQVLVGEGFGSYTYGGRGLHFWTLAAPFYDEKGNLLGGDVVHPRHRRAQADGAGTKVLEHPRRAH